MVLHSTLFQEHSPAPGGPVGGVFGGPVQTQINRFPSQGVPTGVPFWRVHSWGSVPDRSCVTDLSHSTGSLPEQYRPYSHSTSHYGSRKSNS